ncbi:MAG: Fic family protein [Thermus sp.]|uniref:Fic family protein n=1 Tax=Thermus sp. TaxID=275 RepID=UPI0039190F61
MEPYNKYRRWIEERRDVLQRLGGLDLPLVQVANREWLYMLQEDTRHSLAIEGYFTSEAELKEVVRGGKASIEEIPVQILNYFRTAQFVYEQALQDAKEGVFRLDVAFINNIHGQLFRDTPLANVRGKPANGVRREISGAKVRPPLEATDYLRAFVQLAAKLLEEREPLEALAKAHVLFEAIHPYRDGNGRVGRLVLNYMALWRGLPPIAIKGLEEAERKRYYRALEEADKAFHGEFPPANPPALLKALDEGNWQPLACLLGEALLGRLENVLGLALLRYEDLKPIEEVARHLGVSRQQAYVWVNRRRLAVYRPGGKAQLLSHPWLFLGTRERPPLLPDPLPPERPGWPDRVREKQDMLFHPEALGRRRGR